MQLSENEIAFFRYRNRLLAGVCISCGKGKARFTTDGQGPMNVPVENVVLVRGVRTDSPREAARMWTAAEAAGADMDLSEIWDLVQEEPEVWRLEDLGELCLGADVSTGDLGALLLRLEVGDYFVSEDGGYRPLSASDRTRQLETSEREAARQAQRELFQRWIRQDADVVVEDSLLEDWIGRLKDYVLHDAASSEVRWVERAAGERPPLRRCFDRLVSCGAWGQDEHLDLYREEVPLLFSADVVRAADGIDLAPHLDDPARKDLTALPVFTVDDAETKDIDDGLSVEFDPDGGATIGVHITDVASLIPLDGPLAGEAMQRVSSLYFPDARYPMFPERVSGLLGSMVPGEPRLALSLLFPVDAQGRTGTAEIVPSVIRSARRLDYEEVDAILEDRGHRMHAVCRLLRNTAEGMLEQRLLNGAVAIEQPDLKITVDGDGEVSVARRPRNSPANFIVSEMMVLANVALAEYCRERDVPTVYRGQYAPDLTELQEIENEVLYRYEVLRRMQRASMSADPQPHGGLGVKAYCQASSPLRRFGDLTVQRQIVATAMGRPLPYDGPGIQEVIFQAEERARLVRRLERRRERYWLLRYLEGRVGEIFEAVVLESGDRGLKAELLEFGIRVDAKSATRPQPGEQVALRLGRCDAWDGALSFTQGG